MTEKTRIKQAEAAAKASSDPVVQAGTHPLGTTMCALGGAAAGAVMGIAAGPVGSLAGAVGGAIAGGVLGSGAAAGAPVSGPVVEGEPAPTADANGPGTASGNPR
jgi:phage tail tape-measure protein